MHCISVSQAKALVFDDDLFDAVEAIRGDLNALPKVPTTVTFGAAVPAAHKTPQVCGEQCGRVATAACHVSALTPWKRHVVDSVVRAG
jgi:hypothetical protein